jgi:hypothetical protein
MNQDLRPVAQNDRIYHKIPFLGMEKLHLSEAEALLNLHLLHLLPHSARVQKTPLLLSLATSAWAPENPRGPQTDHQDKKAESVLGLAGAANRDKEAAMPAITLAGGLLPAHQRPPPAVRLVLPGPRGLEQPAFAGETLGNEVPCENCLFYVACFL